MHNPCSFYFYFPKFDTLISSLCRYGKRKKYERDAGTAFPSNLTDTIYQGMLRRGITLKLIC